MGARAREKRDARALLRLLPRACSIKFLPHITAPRYAIVLVIKVSAIPMIKVSGFPTDQCKGYSCGQGKWYACDQGDWFLFDASCSKLTVKKSKHY